MRKVCRKGKQMITEANKGALTVVTSSLVKKHMLSDFVTVI